MDTPVMGRAGQDRAALMRAHRREEAERGFPLLRECPSTVVLRRVVALDRLSAADRRAYADQLSDLIDAQAEAPLTQADRGMLLTQLPLVARIEADVPARPDLRFQSVKSLARLAAGPGGIEAFIRLQELTGACSSPPVPHVPTFSEAVPVPPGRLRKAVLGTLQARFGGAVRKVSADLEQLVAEVPDGRMVLNLGVGGSGLGAMSRQLDYSLWADLDRRRVEPTSYEALWLLSAQWDLITVSNVEAAAGHLVRLVEARLELER